MTNICNSATVLDHDAASQGKRPISFADTKNWWWKVSAPGDRVSITKWLSYLL